MATTISPEIGSVCELCGSDEGVNEAVVVPVTTRTKAVTMCSSCRLALTEGRMTREGL